MLSYIISKIPTTYKNNQLKLTIPYQAKLQVKAGIFTEDEKGLNTLQELREYQRKHG